MMMDLARGLVLLWDETMTLKKSKSDNEHNIKVQNVLHTVLHTMAVQFSKQILVSRL